MVEKKSSSNSFLTAAVGAGVAGSAFAAYRLGKNTEPNSVGSFVQTSQTLRKAGAVNSKSEYLNFLKEHIEFMKTPEGAELAKQAWLQAANNVAPTSKDILSFTENLQNVTGANVYDAIKATVERNESQYIGRTVSQFRKTFNALRSHYNLTQTVPEFSSVIPTSPNSLVKPRNVPISQLPKGIQGYITRMQQATGASVQSRYYTRPGWSERGLGMYSFTFHQKTGGKFNIDVPTVSGGLLAEGKTQSAMRIAHSTMLFDKATGAKMGTLSTPEMLLYDIENQVIPGIQSGKYKGGFEVQRAVNDAFNRNIRTLQSVPALPGNIPATAWSALTRIKSQYVDIRMVNLQNQRDIFELPTTTERRTILRSNQGLFPLPSASNLAKARYSMYDPSKLFMTPEALDYSRSPRQIVREWQASPLAQRKLRNSRYTIFETPEWQRVMGTGTVPKVRTTFLDPDKFGNLLGGEGEHFLSQEVRPLLQQTTQAFSPSLRGETIPTNVQSRIQKGGVFKPGEYLGMTTEGSPFTYRKGMQLQSLIQQSTTGKGSFFHLAYNEVYDMSEAEKFFGIKGMGRFKNLFPLQSEIAKGTKNALLTENLEHIASMDMLKKDRQLHNTQMITSLWDMLDRRMSKGASLSGWAQRFHQNPVGIANLLSSQVSEGGQRYTGVTHKQFVSRLMSIATKQLQSSPEEFGAVFGSVPYAMGEDFAFEQMQKLGLSQAHRMSLFAGAAGGISTLAFGGPHSRMAGSMGSIEPRIFEQLTAGTFGKTGEAVASDLFNRLAVTNPEQFLAHTSLTKSLSSMAGEIKPKNGDTIWDVSDINKRYESKAFQDQIEKSGFWLRTGKFNVPDVYVPGAAEGSRLDLFKTASGEVYKGDVASLYHNYARVAANAHKDVRASSQMEVESAFSNLTGAIQKQSAPLGKGSGRLFGGKTLGSQYLTATTEYAGWKAPDLKTVGIGESSMNQMLQEMEETGLYGLEDIGQMRRTLQRGGSVPGMIMRHPDIGSYSQQFANFQMIKGADKPIIAIPSLIAGVGIQGEEELNPINFSRMTGLAGDYDGDTVNAVMLNPKLHKDIEQNFTSRSANSEYDRAYSQHQIRKQLIKAKALGERGEIGETLLDKMIADSEKLGTAETWVPQLSNELTEAKAAIHSQLSGQAAANAREILEFAEQVPVAGKKLSTADVLNRKMETAFRALHESLQGRDEASFTNVMRQMLANSGETTQRLMTEDIGITNASELRAQGLNVDDTIKGWNLEKSASDIMESLRASDASGETKLFNQLRGQGKVSKSALPQYLSAVSEFLDTKTGSTGTVREIVKSTMIGANQLMSMGKKILTNRKVGFGFAGAVGLAMALSSPKDSIGPAVGLNTPSPNLNPQKAARNATPDQIVESQPLGNPTMPSTYAPQARIAPPMESATMSIKARTNGRFNKLQFLNQSQGLSNSVNINVRDNSQGLNRHLLANRLM
jgi:hypothetical protein